MGTYPTTPSYVLATNELLQDVLDANREALIGQQVLDRFGTDLPFLPKILSMSKALPLQLHPNRDLAAKLHKEDPEKYGDTNHKPEIGLALSKFEAFAGFKQSKDIMALLQLEPLKEHLPEGDLTPEGLKTLCSDLLKLPEDKVGQIQSGLAQISKSEYGHQAYILDLLPRLQEQYSAEDNGTLVALICMNYLILQPGEAIYVPADGIHAWLSGDIVECMARSDNVLNVGFCPRADRDNIDLFTNTLTFKASSVQEMYLQPVPSDKSVRGKTVDYRPELSEFNLLKTSLAGPNDFDIVSPIQGPSIMIVTKGKGRLTAAGKQVVDLDEGWVFFVGQGVEIKIEARTELEVYRAYVE